MGHVRNYVGNSSNLVEALKQIKEKTGVTPSPRMFFDKSHSTFEAQTVGNPGEALMTEAHSPREMTCRWQGHWRDAAAISAAIDS